MTPAGPLTASLDVVHYTAGRPVLLPQQFGDATNRTADVLAFLASVPDGSTVDYGEGTRVRCDQTLPLQNRRLTIVNGTTYTDDYTGTGRTLAETQALPDGHADKKAAQARSHWMMYGTDSHMTFRKHEVRGPSAPWWAQKVAAANPGKQPGDNGYDAIPNTIYVPDLAFQHAYDPRFVGSLTLEECTESYVFGDRVCASPNKTPGDERWSEQHTVRGGQAHHFGRQGIALTGARIVLVEDDLMWAVGRSMFDFEPSNSWGGAADVTLRRGKYGQWPNWPVGSGVPDRPGQRNNFLSISSSGQTVRLLVEDVVARKGSVLVSSVGRCADLTFRRYKSLEGIGSTTGRAAMAFTNVDGLTVEECDVPLQYPIQGSPQMAMVSANGCTGVDVLGNGNRFGTRWNGSQWVDQAGSGVTELRVPA